MTLQEQYKDETGEEATTLMDGEWRVYTEDYVEWLEKELLIAKQLEL